MSNHIRESFLAVVRKRSAALNTTPVIALKAIGVAVQLWYGWQGGAGLQTRTIGRILAGFDALERGELVVGVPRQAAQKKLVSKRGPDFTERWDIAEDYQQLRNLRKVGEKHGISHERVRQILNVMEIDTGPQQKLSRCSGCNCQIPRGDKKFCSDECKAQTRLPAKDKKVHTAWRNILKRCNKPNCKNFRYYGGRGITICKTWADDYYAFAKHVGPPPTPRHTIHRIDNDGNYQPGNVRWATYKEQAENRRKPAKRIGRIKGTPPSP